MNWTPLLLAVPFLLVTGDHGFANDQVKAANRYIAGHAVFTGSRDAAVVDTSDLGRDPETSATSFVHAIRRNAKKLLSPQQAKQWEAFIAQRSPQLKQFHDDRNVLRAYFFACAWELPLLETGDSQNAKRKELHQWLDAWMEIRFQEQIAHHRYCSEAFAILTQEQRTALQRGDWDQYVKKSKGHARGYFGDKVVNRAMGKPSDDAALQSLSAVFAAKHKKIQNAILDSETKWRRAAFTTPRLPDVAMAGMWRTVDDAYRVFFLSQAQHIEDLTRAGYDLSNDRVRKQLAAQPAKAITDLDKKIKSKLTTGKQLHGLLQSAR